MVLLVHLLKWQLQPARRSSGWEGTIVEQRRRIQSILARHPGLARQLPQLIETSFDQAKEIAAEETGLAFADFPRRCPYGVREIVDLDFFPG